MTPQGQELHISEFYQEVDTFTLLELFKAGAISWEVAGFNTEEQALAWLSSCGQDSGISVVVVNYGQGVFCPLDRFYNTGL